MTTEAEATVSADTVRPGDAPVLILAATEAELAPLRRRLARAGSLPRPTLLLTTGIGKAPAAAAATEAIVRYRPAVVINGGIAGTYAGAFLPVGVAVAALLEVDLDYAVALAGGRSAPLPLPRGGGIPDPAANDPDAARLGPGAVVPCDAGWTAAAAAACGSTPQRFATSDAPSGDLDVAAERAQRVGAAAESMEGAAVALACLRLGVPFAEVRGISNVAGMRDQATWEVERALEAWAEALLRTLKHGPDDDAAKRYAAACP